MHTFYRGSCPENKCRSLWLMAAAIEKSREVLQRGGTFAETVLPVPQTMVPVPTCSTLLVPVPRKPVPVPQSRRSPIAFWYRYHTYWYRYQHVIFAGFEHNSNLGARVHLSFDHHFEITKEKCNIPKNTLAVFGLV